MRVSSPGPISAAGERGSGDVRSSYRWVILALAWFALLIGFIDRLAWGNVALDVGHALSIPLAALGAIVTAFYIGYVVSNAVFGFVADALGPRLTLSAGLMVLGVLTVAFGFSHSFIQAICIQTLMGIASGVDYSAGVKLNAAWFAKVERGRAFGIYMTATSLAVTVTNSIVPTLSHQLAWNGAYYVLGVATVIAGFVCLALLRDAPQVEASAADRKPNFSALLRKRDLLLVAIAGFGAMWGTWGFAFWANALMVKGGGLAPGQAAGIMVLFGIGAIISKPVIGWISDWLGGKRRTPTIVCLAAFALALLGFGYQTTSEGFRYMAPILGLVAFVYSPLMGAIIAEVSGAELAASATGIINALWQIGSVIVPLAVGAVFQATGSFPAAFVALAIGPAFGALVMLFVRHE